MLGLMWYGVNFDFNSLIGTSTSTVTCLWTGQPED